MEVGQPWTWARRFPAKCPKTRYGGEGDGETVARGGGRGAGGGGRGGLLEGLLEEEVAYEPLVALVEPARPGPTSADGGPPAGGPAASPAQHQGRVQIAGRLPGRYMGEGER